ncbi:SufE family protein [Aestuariivirga sp.]|uniref:SufE family protein n=1 Tax=Aestuariivirga sp. TaxID=2650926 RepID=UPI00391DF993
MSAIADLLADFEILDEWEDRYRHVIDLGRELEPLPEADHAPENKVKGCASQVWITSEASGPAEDPVLTFRGDSDALIVKGLIAIAFMIYSGKPAREILATDAGEILGRLGLAGHLTQQRSNGFASMIQRIKSDAGAALQASSSAAGPDIPGR